MEVLLQICDKKNVDKKTFDHFINTLQSPETTINAPNR